MIKVQSSEFRVQSKKLENKPPNSQLLTPNLEQGFTLVEALISISILAVIGIIMVALLNQSFQLSSKSQIVSKIKQNGQNALNIVDESVRNAGSIVCPQPPPSPKPAGYTSPDPDILVTEKNGKYTRFYFHSPAPAANGYIGQETYDVQDKYCLDPLSGGIDPSNKEIKLTDTDKVTGVSLQNGQFTPSGSNLVTVQFDLGPGIDVPSSFDKQTSLIHFQTTLTTRQR